VQGVGFRPFIYRLAEEMNLKGWVINNTQGVFIEAEATPEVLRQFLLRIEREKPAVSFIQSFEHSFVDPVSYEKFEIRESTDGAKTALILPGITTCNECQREIFDPVNRRYRYRFTNCTNCGPRFTIIGALPYDRPRTSMRLFDMCPECSEEYHNPRDRRSHAQPNACPEVRPSSRVVGRDRRCYRSWRRRIAPGGGRNQGGADCGGERPRRFPLNGGCVQRSSGPTIASAQAPGREALCPDASFVASRGSARHCRSDGRTVTALAGGADSASAPRGS
jgi:acylphosphatase